MKVTCPSCSRQIPPEDVNILTAMAKCSVCKESFTVSARELGLIPENAWPKVTQSKNYTNPKEITVEHTESAVIIRNRWFNRIAIIILSAFVLITSFELSMPLLDIVPKPFLKLLIPSVLPVVVAVYLTIATIMNSTEIKLTKDSIIVRHYPLPWVGNKVVPIENIIQLFCVLTPPIPLVRGNIPTYDVWILYEDRKRVKLVGRIYTTQQAQFIEQHLEAALGIDSFPVAGEMGAV